MCFDLHCYPLSSICFKVLVKLRRCFLSLQNFPMAGNLKGAANQVARYNETPLTRHDFPADFIWGAATSTYQVEGGYRQGNKSLNNWDVWTLERPGKIVDGNNGCVAIDNYNRFKEDVRTMKKLGLDTYRFSISWSRILPGGRLSTGVNQEGVKFYNDLIDALLAEGIIPFVTLFHFDHPQCLLEEYGAFMHRRIVEDFAEYAEVCFYEFGDRVKHWITMNEPFTFTFGGYVTGTFPPGHGSVSTQPGATCRNLRHRTPLALGLDITILGGNAGTEPYIVAHHLLLSHARAVQIYRNNYQAVQGGKIGITNMTTWYEPYTSDPLDVDAASRAVDFQWGWFTAPVVTGDYPPVMRERVGSRLPTFNEEEKRLMTQSFDFIGMNYYTTYLAQNDNPTVTPIEEATYYTDLGLQSYTAYPDGTPIGEQAASAWLYIVPRGIYELLKHNATTYGNPDVYITENGVDEKKERIPITLALKDDYRIKYFKDHFAYMKLAIDEGVNLKGYMLWALFDNFEWSQGYTVRFGIYYVDFENNMTRYPKKSAIWYMNFLNKNLPLPDIKRQALVEVEADNTSARRKRARN